MSKLLVKFKYDMNDGDYIYGIHVIDEKEWKKLKFLWEIQEGVCVYHNNDSQRRNYNELLSNIFVEELTEEEYNVLEKLGLIDFGQDLPDYDELYDEEEEGRITIKYASSEEYKVD